MAIDRVEMALLTAAVVVVTGFGFLLYGAVSQGPRITIDLTEWSCASTAERTTSRALIVGKVVMMLPHRETVCTDYHRN